MRRRIAVFAGGCALVLAPAAAGQVRLTRDSLAKNASFVVTSTLIPQGGSKETQVFRVEVSGERARLDYSDAALGQVRYLVNEKGAFFFIPANKAAQRVSLKGGIEQALKLTFAQAVEQMQSARKVGKATVSGQPVEIYKNASQGTTIYLGTNPGFRLPVKLEWKNEGGRRTLLASNIRLNNAIPAARFALPPGTQIIESQGGPGALSGGLPGVK